MTPKPDLPWTVVAAQRDEAVRALADECLAKDGLLKETLGLLENCNGSRGWNIEADRLARKVRMAILAPPVEG